MITSKTRKWRFFLRKLGARSGRRVLRVPKCGKKSVTHPNTAVENNVKLTMVAADQKVPDGIPQPKDFLATNLGVSVVSDPGCKWGKINNIGTAGVSK